MATTLLLPTLATIGDPDGTRTVTSIIVLLVAIGLALVLLAVWIHKATRPDPELLAPLEVMGERAWRRGDPVWQRRRLDELRPPGAQPLAPSAAPPELDESFEAGPSAPGFDDLHDAPTASESDPELADAADDVAPPDRDDTVAIDDDTEDAVHEPEVADEPASADAAVEDAEAAAPSEGPTAAPKDSTPPGLLGPEIDLFPDDEFDQDALAAAREQLERELAAGRAEQLGLFDGDRPS